MFDLVEYIKRNLVNGFKDGTWTESKVAQLSVGYYQKEIITLEDIEEIDTDINDIKAEIERQKAEREAANEELTDEYLDDSGSDTADSDSRDDGGEE